MVFVNIRGFALPGPDEIGMAPKYVWRVAAFLPQAKGMLNCKNVAL